MFRKAERCVLSNKDNLIVIIRWMLITTPLILCMIMLWIDIRCYSVKEQYELQWNIKLPDKAAMIEDYNQHPFDGEKCRYTVLYVPWEEMKGYGLRKYNDEELDFCIDVLNVYKKDIEDIYPSEKRLYYAKIVKNNSKLVLIYNKKIERLFLFMRIE